MWGLSLSFALFSFALLAAENTTGGAERQKKKNPKDVETARWLSVQNAPRDGELGHSR